MSSWGQYNSARLWSQSTARRSMMGKERTNNPTPAAARLLGKKRVARARFKLKRAGKRRAYRGNPSPGVVGTLGSVLPGGGIIGSVIGALGGRFRKPSEVRAAAVAPSVIASANAGNLVAVKGIIHRAEPTFGIAKERAVWQAALTQVKPALVAAAVKQDKQIPEADQSNPEAFQKSVLAAQGAMQLAGAASAPPSFIEQAGAYFTPGTVSAVARAVTPRRSSRRQRYPTYTDRQGRQRYSTKPPGSQMRLPAGAVPSPGTAYSFFRGAVGKGGAGTTAAQLGVAAAAGAAAYLVTQKLLQYLGGRAQGKEEAGVLAARALHEALEEYKHRFGKYPPPAERREMKAAYRAKLDELGYDPDRFTRTRGAVAGFLEDYNPFGG